MCAPGDLYLYTCGGCVGADDYVVGPPEDIWSQLVVSGFKAVSGALGDPQRQPRAAAAVTRLAGQAADLQPLLQARIAKRRLVTHTSMDVSVRGLEDAAVHALAAAVTGARSCEALAQQGHYLEAFQTCVSAMRSVESSDALMRAAWFLDHPPSKPVAAAR